jgi:hypothetical protein
MEKIVKLPNRGHGGTGFFSNCSILLYSMAEYFNKYKSLPEKFDTSSFFKLFNSGPHHNPQGVIEKYFKIKSEIEIPFTRNIDYHKNHWATNYKELDFSGISPFIKKYFSPSEKVKEIISFLENKYSLDYDNLYSILYRGNDKCVETYTGESEVFFQRAERLALKNPKATFLLQSDETEFLTEGAKRFPRHVIFHDEIKHMKSSPLKQINRENKTTIEIDSLNYLAITYIIAKCKHIVCGTGNCDIWACLFRGDAHNINQYFAGFCREQPYDRWGLVIASGQKDESSSWLL